MKTILSSFGIHLPDQEKEFTFAKHSHKISTPTGTPIPDEKVKELSSNDPGLLLEREEYSQQSSLKSRTPSLPFLHLELENMAQLWKFTTLCSNNKFFPILYQVLEIQTRYPSFILISNMKPRFPSWQVFAFSKMDILLLGWPSTDWTAVWPDPLLLLALCGHWLHPLPGHGHWPGGPHCPCQED